MRPLAVDGLQASRTTLSWRRTVASAGAAAALVAHRALMCERGWATALLLLAAAIGPLGLGIAANARRHHRLASPRLIGLAAATVALLALLALAAIWV